MVFPNQTPVLVAGNHTSFVAFTRDVAVSNELCDVLKDHTLSILNNRSQVVQQLSNDSGLEVKSLRSVLFVFLSSLQRVGDRLQLLAPGLKNAIIDEGQERREQKKAGALLLKFEQGRFLRVRMDKDDPTVTDLTGTQWLLKKNTPITSELFRCCLQVFRQELSSPTTSKTLSAPPTCGIKLAGSWRSMSTGTTKNTIVLPLCPASFPRNWT
jgi:hypothetical protein